MKIIFCDTTLEQCDLEPTIADAYVFKPAIKRGDLVNILAKEPSLIEVVIVDGVFEQSPSITHKEIMLMISRGVKVVGIASMGALRAAELHQFGMIGFGEIFEAYFNGNIDSDDEVAVSYVERRGAIYKTLPLINIRATVDKFDLSPNIFKKAKNIFYKDRCWERLKKVFSGFEYDSLKDNYIDLKKQDVMSYLEKVEVKTACTMNKTYNSLYLANEIEKANKRGPIKFITYCIEQKKMNNSYESYENNKLSVDLAKFINLDQRHAIKINHTLQNISGIYITSKYIASFKKHIIKEIDLYNKEQLSKYLVSLNIDKSQLEDIFVGLYKLYRIFIYETYSKTSLPDGISVL